MTDLLDPKHSQVTEFEEDGEVVHMEVNDSGENSQDFCSDDEGEDTMESSQDNQGRNEEDYSSASEDETDNSNYETEPESGEVGSEDEMEQHNSQAPITPASPVVKRKKKKI